MSQNSAYFSANSDIFRSLDYKNKQHIYSTFNRSVLYYRQYRNSVASGDDEGAAFSMIQAGTLLYDVCEWGFKNNLYNYYENQKLLGIISQEICEIEQRFVRVKDGREVPMRLYDLARKMEYNERAAVKQAEFSLSVIYNNSQEVNNDPKHNGCIPNSEAYELVLPEARKLLSTFIDKEGEANLARIEDGDNGEWEKFIIGCDYFTSDGSYSYILVTDAMPDNPNLEALFYVNWDLVLDLDPYSNTEGGLVQKYVASQKKYPHLISLDFKSTLRSYELSSMPYWVMLNGDVSDPNTKTESDDGLRKHNIKYLYGLLDKFHSFYTKPAKVVIATCENYPKSIVEIINKLNDSYNYNEGVSFNVLSCGYDFYRIHEDNFSQQPLGLPGFLENLKYHFSSNVKSLEGKTTIPGENKMPKEIKYDEYSAMSDSMELLYLGIEKADGGNSENISPISFYHGRSSISWYCLQKSFDVRRSNEQEIIENIKQELVSGRPPIKQVLYAPGLGGTTFMRRAAFQLHTQYPTVIVRRFSEDTGEYLKKLYNISKLPLAIFIDSNDLSPEDAMRLHATVKPFFSFTIIYFFRQMNGDKTPDNVIGQLTRLNPDECKSMSDLLQPYINNDICRQNLANICANKPYDVDHTPFILAMYAYDKEFEGTKKYITNFLRKMPQEHKDILCYIALANYVDTNIDEQFFVDLTESTNLRFMTEPSTPFYSLIKRVTDQSKKKKYFKIRHHLFGEEILYQLSDNESSSLIRFSGLLAYIKRFIRSSRKNPYLKNNETIKLMEDLFIKREEDEDTTTASYARLIEKLREECPRYLNGYDESQDMILSIFNELVTVYPDVPHFIAHMARYYFYNDNNDKGFEKINEAIAISENGREGGADPTLYHMKAMGYSVRITKKHREQVIQVLTNGTLDSFSICLAEIESDAENAFNLFDLTRKCNAKGIAAYIADINLCISLVQIAQKIQEICAERQFDVVISPNWYNRYLDRAQTLLEDSKQIAIELESKTFDESKRIDNVERQLRILEGNVEDTIAICKEFLQDSTLINKPKYRRILARAYQKQIDTSNDNMKSTENQKRIVEIVRLMEENIHEEPQKSGNIRIWFNAVRRLSTDSPEDVLVNALDNLNLWLSECPSSVEAHFYRFIIKFIQMIEGSLIAQGNISILLSEMRSHTANLPNRTVITEWLGAEGLGLGRLISASEFWRQKSSDEELIAKLYKLKGQLPSKEYFNGKTAYLYYKRNEVYFKPSALTTIGPSNERQWVEFGIGFSYDGPRAFNNSISLLAPGTETETDIRQELFAGDVVTCEVTFNGGLFTDVLIRGTGGRTGSIHYTNLSEEYSREKRPIVGSTIKAQLINLRDRGGKMIWALSMKIRKNETLTDNRMADQLRKWKERNKEE